MWSYSSTAWTDQIAGRYRVLVTLLDGGKPESFFLSFNSAPDQTTIDTAATALAATKNSQYADAELQRCLDNDNFSAPQYQTAAQFAARFRAMFLRSSKQIAAHMAYWLVERVLAGDITQTQIKNVFGFTDPQYTAFSSRMQTLHDAYLATINAQGE